MRFVVPSSISHARSSLRPQSVIFTLLAEHLLDTQRALFAGSFIEVLGRLDIGEHATRSTLARMMRRGLLTAERRSRKSYLRMTPRCRAILEDGRRRIWHLGVVNGEQPVHWTMLTFSIPESWREKRASLRARLGWAGFGLLQNGVWLAPASVDVAPLIEGLGLAKHVRAFHVQPTAPTEASALIGEAFDLAQLAERYRAFLRRWQRPRKALREDALGLTLRLSTEWLSIIRDDPRVPLPLLPEGWPAVAAQQLFRALHGKALPDAEALARALFETV